MAATLVIVSPRSAPLVARFGPRRVVTAGLLTMASGLAGLGLLTTGTPYLAIVLVLVAIGAGMGMVMPPSTGQIMSAMPVDKAGVGSAVNDTVREVGGATGIAVLGSIVAVAYRDGLGDLLATAPAAAREAAGSSVAAALQVVSAAPDPVVAEAVVRTSFTDAIGLAFLVAAAMTVVNAALVWRYGPRVASYHELRETAPVAVSRRRPAAPRVR